MHRRRPGCCARAWRIACSGWLRASFAFLSATGEAAHMLQLIRSEECLSGLSGFSTRHGAGENPRKQTNTETVFRAAQIPIALVSVQPNWSTHLLERPS